MAHVAHPHHQHAVGPRGHAITLLHRGLGDRARLEGVEAFCALAVQRDLDDRGQPDAERLRLLDDPTLGLARKIVESIFAILAELHRDGMSLLIVEKNVHAVLALVQRAYILEGGRIVGEGDGKTLLADDHIQAAYLGPLARAT